MMNDTPRDDQLDEVLAAYMEAESNGWAPPRQRLLACYPHLAEEIARFLNSQDLVEDITAPLRPQPELATPRIPAMSPTVADNSAPTDETPRRRTFPPVPGYEILDVIARGGMGVIYRARQLHANREVALKMILSGGHAGDQERARF